MFCLVIYLSLFIGAFGRIRLCADHMCTVPVYRGLILEDWSDPNPVYLDIFKGSPVTVFGVEGNHYDAESKGQRGFIPQDKAEISERLREPTIEFNPYFKKEEDPTSSTVVPESATDQHQKESEDPPNNDEVQAKLRAEEEARMKAEEEAKLNAEQIRLKAEEEARQIAERLKAEEEVKQKAEEEARQIAERLKAEDEAKQKAEEEAKQKAEEEAKLKAEEEAKLKAEEEERARQAELDLIAEQKRLEDEAEQMRIEEDAKIQREEQQKKEDAERTQEEKRLKEEEEERRRTEEERLEEERQEKERAEFEKIEQEKLALEEEKQRKIKERDEKERQRQEKIEERRIEKERREKEKAERERAYQEKLQEAERVEKERIAKEQERLEKERLEHDEAEKERIAVEEKRRQDEQQEQERNNEENTRKAIEEQERLQKETSEKERIEAEKLRIIKEQEGKARQPRMRIGDKRKSEEESRKAEFEAKKQQLEQQYKVKREKLKEEQLERERKQNIDRNEINVPVDQPDGSLSNGPQDVCEGDSCQQVEQQVEQPQQQTEQSGPAAPNEQEQSPEQPQPTEPAVPEPPSPEEEKEEEEEEGKKIGADQAIDVSEDQNDEEEEDLGEPVEPEPIKTPEPEPEPEIPQTIPEPELKKEETPGKLLKEEEEEVKVFRRISPSKDISAKPSLPFYCSIPLVSSLCESAGSEAAILIVIATIFVAGLVAFVVFMSPITSPENQMKGRPTPREIITKPDPKILESLEEHGKTQQQIDNVSSKLVELMSEIKDMKVENGKYKNEVRETRERLTNSLEKTIVLERDLQVVQAQLNEQTRYNSGFEELETKLKGQIKELEIKLETSQSIIKTQEFTANSTSDQIAALQSQLELIIEDKQDTQETLELTLEKVENLSLELEETQERLTVTQDLLDQANGDTEAWTVRVQILSLELGEANGGIASLKEELETKSRDLDIIRECLVDLRGDQAQEDQHVDFSARFKEMVDVSSVKQENEKLVESNRDLLEDLEEVREARDLYEERIQEVEEELEALKLGKDEEVAKRVEFSTKFETLSSYFKEKEDGLHCRLSELQVKCKQLEEESSEANILFYKDELSRLKKSHAETERNLTLQIQTNERKAKDAFSQLRSKDSKLKDANEIIKKLKKSNGTSSNVVIPEDGPAPGPPFIDFPPILRKSGPPDSPSESSLTSAEDFENRRLERKMEFEKDRFHPDLRYDEGRFLPRPFSDELYRDPRDALFAPRDYHPFEQLPRSRDSSRPSSVGREDRIHPAEPPFYPPRDLPPRDLHLPPRTLPPRLPSRDGHVAAPPIPSRIVSENSLLLSSASNDNLNTMSLNTGLSV